MSMHDRTRMGAIPLAYLTIDGVATQASVSSRTVRRWMYQGLPYYQATPHGRVLIRLQDVEQFLTRKQAPQLSLGSLVDQVLRDLNGRGK